MHQKSIMREWFPIIAGTIGVAVTVISMAISYPAIAATINEGQPTVNVSGDQPTSSKITIDSNNFGEFFKNTGLTEYNAQTGTVTFPTSTYSGDPTKGSILMNGKTYKTTLGSDGLYYVNVDGKRDRVFYAPNDPDWHFQWVSVSGQTYMTNNIDLHKSFEFKGTYNLTPGPDGVFGNVGDGVSFMFKTGDPALLGIGGAGFGVGGLKGAFGFAIDGSTYGDPADTTQHVPTIQMFQTTGDNSQINTGISDKPLDVNFLGTPSTFAESDYVGAEKQLPIDIKWDAQSQTLTYKLFKSGSDSEILSQGSQNFSDYLKKYGYYASFAVSSSNGGTQSTVQLKIDSIDYSVVGVVNVDYLEDQDSGTKAIIPAEQQRGSLGTDAQINAYPNGVDQKKYRLVKVDAPEGYKLSGDLLTLPFGGVAGAFPYANVVQNIKLHYKKITNPSDNTMNVLIEYVDQNGNQIAKSEKKTGQFGDSINIQPVAIDGYTPDSDNPKTFKFGTLDENGDPEKVVMMKYTKVSHSNTPTNPANPTNPVVPNPSPSPNPSPISPVVPATPNSNSNPSTTTIPDYAAKKGAAVYGINNLYLYKKANFTKGQRIAKYMKKPRIYRPMFVVTDYARSITGKLRYKVTDVNHNSKTVGKSGYITASWKYVRPVYYASKHSRITVISPKGVNAYETEALTGKVKNYKQGTVLKVKGMVRHNLTTRYILTNGKYVTANRKLVNMGRHKTVKKVRAKTTINRYKNVNLSKRNQTFKKGKVFKVYNYDYSHGYNLHKHGALRYHVAGGYITGNSKYVKVIQ